MLRFRLALIQAPLSVSTLSDRRPGEREPEEGRKHTHVEDAGAERYQPDDGKHDASNATEHEQPNEDKGNTRDNPRYSSR